MANVTSITQVKLVNDYAEWLRSKAPQVGMLGAFWHGFEGWLKAELALMLCSKHKRIPWIKGSWGTIGLEYKALLKSDPSHTAHREKNPTKQVDLWTTANRRANVWREHYVELKTVFRGTNELKQIYSALADLAALSRIDDLPAREQRPEAGIVIAIGVDFESCEAFRTALETRMENSLRSTIKVLKGRLVEPDPNNGILAVDYVALSVKL